MTYPGDDEKAAITIDAATETDKKNVLASEMAYSSDDEAVARANAIENENVIVKSYGVGSAQITVEFGETDNYLAGSATFTVTVRRVTQIEAISVEDMSYTGSEITPDEKVTAVVDEESVVLVKDADYTLTFWKDEECTDSIDELREVGTYYAKAEAVDGSDYIGSVTCSFKILPRSVAADYILKLQFEIGH